jgi:ferredoxin
MPKITFIENGESKTFDVENGLSVLEIAHQNNIDLEGACEGSLACSTCHVVVNENDFDKLEEATEEEEDMLDLAFGVTTTSRLGCQIIMSDDLDGLTLTIPSQTRNIDAKKITNQG